MLENYSYVRLLSNRFTLEGVQQGDWGIIIEVYPPDGYMVDFGAYTVDNTNPEKEVVTYTFIDAKGSDLELCESLEEANRRNTAERDSQLA